MLLPDLKTALVVAAHPDDEALGCGGTMARLASAGVDLHVMFMTDGVNARGTVADEAASERRAMGDRAAQVLGAQAPTYGSFPDNRMDSVDLLDIAVAVERRAAEVRPELVLTHAPGDLNIDHRRTCQAVLTAFRPQPGNPVRAIWGFEVASSTEWAFGATGPTFTPNLFVDIGAQLELKLDALRAYQAEMRDYPHARSVEALAHAARHRGAAVGVQAAEAFVVLRHCL